MKYPAARLQAHTAAASVFSRLVNRAKKRDVANLPPGPRGWPLLGCGPEFMRDPLDFALRMSRYYGDVTTTRMAYRTLIWISHPRLVEEVFVAQHNAWRKDSMTRELAALLGDGLLTSEGGHWRTQRKLAAPAFVPKRIAAYAQTMSECTARFAGSLRDCDVRDMHADIMQLTLEIVGRTLLGVDTRQDSERVANALGEVMHYFDKRMFSPFGLVMPFIRTPTHARFERAIAKLDAVVGRIIESARRDPNADHLLARLLSAQTEDGERMSDRQARDEAMTMLLAGHETTALAITFALHALSAAPDCEARLRQEIEQLGGGLPTSSDLTRMPYLDAVVKEVMRLYPPAWGFGRQLTAEIELDGYRLPPGVEIVCSPYAMHRDPRFFEAPDTFMPERWLGDGQARLPRYAYLPFGAGARSCIGSHFAKLEAALVLATLLQQVRLRVVPGYRLDLRPVITLRPEGGLPMLVRRVKPQRVAA